MNVQSFSWDAVAVRRKILLAVRNSIYGRFNRFLDGKLEVSWLPNWKIKREVLYRPGTGPMQDSIDSMRKLQDTFADGDKTCKFDISYSVESGWFSIKMERKLESPMLFDCGVSARDFHIRSICALLTRTECLAIRASLLEFN